MRNIYPNIDLQLTGMKIQEMLKESRHSVKELQDFLNLEGPQPIYRWIQGKTLPSVYNLYALAYFLNVKIDDLLVRETKKKILFEYNKRDADGYMHRIYIFKNLDSMTEDIWKLN